MAKKSVVPRSRAKKGKATRKRPARIKKPVSVVVAAPPKTGSVTRRFVVLAVAMVITVGAGMLIRSGQAATFQGPSEAPPGGNIPVTIWNSVATGTQQTSASITIDGGGPAGTNPVGLSVGSNAADLGVGTGGHNVIYGVGDPTKMHAQDYLFLLQAPAGTNRFSVDDAGNVGIGVVPNNKLQVAGLINFNNTTTSTFLGNLAGNISTAAGNSYIGYNTGFATTTGASNTAVGAFALDANTTGFNNTAIGYNALTVGTVGNNNTAIGYGALAPVTGSLNVAVGSQALSQGTTGGQNVAMGVEALRFATTASNNTAIGWQALYASTGGNNVGLGYRSGATNTTGTLNTLVGYNANVSAAGFTNATALGANAVVGQSNALVLGSGARVGINLPTPGYSLDMREAAGAGGTAIVNINQDNAVRLYTGLRLARLGNAERWFMGMNDVDDKWRLRKSPTSADVVIVDTTGNVNVNGGGLSTVSNDVTQLADTTETSKMCLGNAATGNEAFCRTSWPMGVDSYDPTICFGPVFVGDSTTTSSGNVGASAVSGYRRANELCAATHGAGAHVCSVDEILTSVKCSVPALITGEVNGQFFWLNGGPPGFTAPAKDCDAWTDGSGGKYGRIWETNSSTGGVGSLTTCNATLPFACCK